jgi:protein arginine N-methyltransferase 3
MSNAHHTAFGTRRLYEAMLDSVLVARDLYLKPGGLLVPSQCSILIAGIQDDEYLKDSINFWDDVYGLKMSAMKDDLGKEAEIRVADGNKIISTVASIKVSVSLLHVVVVYYR